MRNVDYSEILSFAANDKKNFKLSFLKAKGPRGGRNVLSKLRILVNLQVDTDGATTIAAGGWCKILAGLIVKGPQGEFINLDGPDLRLLHILSAGREAVSDPAALAISQSNATRELELVLDFAPFQRSKRRWDYAVPVDHLLSIGDSAIEIRLGTAADLGTGGGTTLDSATIQLIAETREETDIQDHVWRELRTVSQNQLTDFELPANGGWIRTCLAYKPLDHITGGTDMSSCTAVMVPSLGIDSVDPAHLRRAFVDEGGHDRASTSDPFVQTTERVVLVVWPSWDEKFTDMPRHTSKMGIRLVGNTVANVRLFMEMCYEGTPKSTAVEQAYAAALGLNKRSIKTEGKTKREPGDWPGMANLMPAKLYKEAKVGA